MGVREFTIETWDTILFSLSLMVAILVFDPDLTILALLPVPAAMLLAVGSLGARRLPGKPTALSPPPSKSRYRDPGAPPLRTLRCGCPKGR